MNNLWASLWASIKQWEIREWLTLAFSALAVFVPWRIHRHNVRKAADAATSNWSIRLVPYMDVAEGFLWAQLRLEDPNENRFRLISLTAKGPKGVLMTGSEPVNQTGTLDIIYVPKPEVPMRVLLIERALSADRYYGNGPSTAMGYSTTGFLLKMPARPWYTSAPRVRAEIEATVEEISSTRRVSRITIKTEPIPWAVQKDPT